MKILGISAFYHDAAAAQEERFTRRKHDPAFPAHAIRYCLEASGTAFEELEAVAFYDKPFLKFERLLETYYAFAPRGLRSFLAAMAAEAKKLAGSANLCLAGGALGAALCAHHIGRGNPRTPGGTDRMRGSYLGPEPKETEIQKKLNLKIKYRESFRPFAPSVLGEECANYFELDEPLPYMLLIADVQPGRRRPPPPNYHALPLREKLYHQRSDIPAVTHLDYSARIQTVHRETNPDYWLLSEAFRQRTGYGLVVNTSFNVPASRSSARRRMPTAVSCARKWTLWSSATGSSRRRTSPRGPRAGSGASRS